MYKMGMGEHSKTCDYNISIHEEKKNIDVQSFRQGQGEREKTGWMVVEIIFSELKIGPQDLTKVTLGKSFNFSVPQFSHL